MTIDGIVLAAGASTRMGEPKALLQVDGVTFLERAVHLLRDAGCRYVVAVVNDDDWIERLADVSGAAVVINADPGAQQIESLRLGIANLPAGADAVLVLPVDYPRVSQATVRELMRAFERTGAPVLNPAYRGRAGHPVLFAQRVLPELFEPGLVDGARSVIAAHAEAAVAVEVDDWAVSADVDTPEDYLKIVKENREGKS